MKIKIIIFVLCLLSFACGTVVINNNRSVAQSPNNIGGRYGYVEREIDGMKYGIYYVGGTTSGSEPDYMSGQTGYDIEVINLTKEKLEVELLQKELDKYPKK